MLPIGSLMYCITSVLTLSILDASQAWKGENGSKKKISKETEVPQKKLQV